MYVQTDLSGVDKTALLYAMAQAGAVEPRIRSTAVALVANLPSGAHRKRLARLHDFVATSIAYHREPIEMLHWPLQVLHEGGDCDDHAILLPALAWSLKYPFAIVPVGNPSNPSHYTVELGYPESETPRGDARTVWLPAETTIPARLGEALEDAVARVGPDFRDDLSPI